MTAPPLKVTYLIAVWGEAYIHQFMDLSLRSLLSPGNIPALSQHAQSTFIFLTCQNEREIFEKHPLFKRLSYYCTVEFVAIDDLIFSANYSATLTIAYERGMRHGGNANMLSTYYFYLVADYVVADGSLANLLPHLQKGISGITSGNFQVVEEDMQETFMQRVDRNTGILNIPARELMRMTLPYLHPLTVANTVNDPYNHTEHSNRLFWRVDDNTMIGRFYLRHMLCIKPERSDYVIGASCDYSFIDEMCPSGNVHHITDSDEFCLVEMQPYAHEQKFIRQGPFKLPMLVKSLNQWTTASQRKNVFNPIIFHSSEIPASASLLLKESESYVAGIDKKLLPPMPVGHHPYWTSCLDGILEHIALYDYNDRYYSHGLFAGIIGSKVFEPPLGQVRDDYNLLKTNRIRYGSQWRARLLKIARMLYGTEADCLPWHRYYSHSKAVDRAVSKVSANSDYFYIITSAQSSYIDYLHKHYQSSAILQKSELFLLRAPGDLKEMAPMASEAIIFITPQDLKRLGELLAKCEQCLVGGKHVTVVVTQMYFSPKKPHFGQQLAIIAASFNGGTVEIESFTSISNPMRKWLDIPYKLQVEFLMSAKLKPASLMLRLLPAVTIALTNIGYAIGNLLSRAQPFSASSRPTCAIIRLRLRGKSQIMPASEAA